MGGRGVSAFGGGGGGHTGGAGKGIVDDSGIGTSRGIASATNMVVGAFGTDSIQKAIDYVGAAMNNITGRDNYVNVEITGSATGEGGTYAWMSPLTGTMGLNTDYLKYDTAKVAKTYENDVAAGFHPKGTTYKDIMVHEAAHRLDGILSQKMNNGNLLGPAASTRIVKEAWNNMKANGAKGTIMSAQQSLSGYGAGYYARHTGDKYIETFAEAIADYNANGSKANPLSREIASVTKKYVNRYR